MAELEIANTQQQFVFDSTDSKLLDNIYRNNHVLIVGSEAILRKDNAIANGSGDSWQLLENSYDEISRGHRGEPEDQKYNYAWENIVESRSRKELLALVDDQLMALLETQAFPVVFTTCIDPLLELAMKEVWKNVGEVKIFNFSNPTDVSSLNTLMQNSDEIKSPTLCYLYGRIDDSLTRNSPLTFVHGDDDGAMVRISELIKMSVNHVSIPQFIRKRMTIAIGCRCDDWRFRFFWYALRDNTIDPNTQCTVAYSIGDTKEEIKNIIKNDPLSNYLSQYRKVNVEVDSREFMKRLHYLLTAQPFVGTEGSDKYNFHGTYNDLLQLNSKKGKSIFISYAHEDFAMAYRIFRDLVNRGFSVWLDRKELHTLDEYNGVIDTALDQCIVFMPLLSAQTASDLKNKKAIKERYYISTEWTTAVTKGFTYNKENGEKIIIPIIVGNYSLSEKYHKKFLELTKAKDEFSIYSYDEMEKISSDLKDITTRIVKRQK